eukprot:97719_1
MSAFFDSVDGFFEGHAESGGGILFEVFCVIYCFFALAIVCDEYLAPALETLCVRWGVREDVAGATFLAFGSAAPEIVINAVATLKSQVTSSNTTSLGISAIIGSGMLAFSFIPAMCCFVSELTLQLKRRPLLRDESFYLIALFTLCAAFHDGKIVFLESVFLVLIYCGHLATVVTSPWVRKTYRYKVKGIKRKTVGAQDSFVHKARAELERQRSLKRAKSQPTSVMQTSSAPVTPTGKNVNNNPPGLKRASTANALFTANNMGSINSVPVQIMSDTSKNSNSNYAQLPGFELDTEEDESIDIVNDSMAQAVSTNQIKLHETMEDPLLDNINDNEELDMGIVRQISNNSSIQTDNDYYENDLNDSGSSGSDEGPITLSGKLMHWFTIPLQLLFKLTCPPAGEGEKCEHLYGVTFAISVIHVAIFSFILSSVVGAWVSAWGMPQALFGMLLIAIGAEIPDTIESVTMARKTYGSMAVSNCQGTQVINIGIGLGLPWLLTNLTGNNVIVCGHKILQVSAIFQTCIVCSNFFLLVGLALIQKSNKASFERWKAYTLIVLYFIAMLGFTLYLYFSDELFKDTCK